LNTYRADAVVLRTKELNEGNRLLILFSRAHGKIRAMAYGAAKPGSRKRGAVQPFCYSDFLLVRGREWDTVSQAETREMFVRLRDDLDLLGYASHFAELVDLFTPAGEPNEPLFHLLLAGLGFLGTVDAELLARSFELRALGCLGYRPELERCASCGGSLPRGPLAFDPAAGGVVCGECARTFPAGHRPPVISAQALAVMRSLVRLDPGRVGLLQVPARAREEIKNVQRLFWEYHLEHRARSLGFLEDLGRRGP